MLWQLYERLSNEHYLQKNTHKFPKHAPKKCFHFVCHGKGETGNSSFRKYKHIESAWSISVNIML